MEFREVIERRHSSRDFRPDAVDREPIRRILHAAALAPSAMNEQPWRFYVATGESRVAIGELISQATVHLVDYMEVLGPEHYEDAVQWYSSLGNAPVLIVVTAPQSDTELTTMNRLLAVGGAVQSLLLAATDEGLAACNITFSYWVETEIAEYLHLPDDQRIVTIVAIGWPGAVPPAAPEHREDVAVWLE